MIRRLGDPKGAGARMSANTLAAHFTALTRNRLL
jgi:hypothetical protein